MTRNEIYCIIEKGTKEGMFPSIDSNNRCLYRGDDNKKCIVGILIPDHMYDGFWDTMLFRVYSLPERVLKHIGIDVNTLGKLQALHDNYAMQHKKFNHVFLNEVKRILQI